MTNQPSPASHPDTIMEIEPHAANLDYLHCIAFSGEDTETFLQGQFTNDLAKLQPGQQQLGAYCNPKGRALCVFRLLRTVDHWLMILPGELSDAMVKRLTLYRMRAKVSIELLETTAILGIIHPPQAVVEISDIDRIWQLDDHRYLVLTDNKTGSVPGYPDETRQDTAMWKLSEILSGIPEVYQSTSEQFIPQHINLDLAGGVSFSKGCYPGQEIVARLRYLGKLKQRMIATRSDVPEDFKPGDPVFTEKRGNQKAGQVVETVNIGTVNYALLSVSADVISVGDIAIGAVEGPVASRIALPYEITV